MADTPETASEVPRQFPSVPPPVDLYPTSDIRFVLIELGKIGTKIDGLSDKIEKQTTKVEVLERTVDRVKTGGYVAIAILGAVGAFAWWAIGDRITNAVRVALAIPALQVEAPKPPAAPASPPPKQTPRP